MKVSIVERDGKHYLRWPIIVDGKRKYKEKRASDHPAERIRQQRRMQRRLAHAEHSQPLMEAWVDHRQDLEPATLRSYERALERFVALTGCQDTWDITRELLRGYRAALGEQGLAPRTCNSELARVAAILHQFRRADLTPDLHKDDVGDTLRRFKTRRNPPRPYSPAKLQAILRAIDRRDVCEPLPFRPLFLFALLTGMRRAEIFAFRPHWLDLEAGAIHVPSRKTTRGRTVNLTVSPLLQGLLSKDLGTITSWSEWPAEHVRRHLTPKWTWQGLRVTCASYLVNSNVLPAWLAARQLGHSQEVADDHYRGVVVTVPSGVTSLEQALGIFSPFSGPKS